MKAAKVIWHQHLSATEEITIELEVMVGDDAEADGRAAMLMLQEFQNGVVAAAKEAG